MATISLNVYKKDSKTEVEKTYQVEGYELMLGTVEDFMAIIDIDKLGNNIEAAKMLLKCYKQLKPLLKDIFPELTDDEMRCVKTNELVETFKQVGAAIVEGFGVLKQGN